MTQKSFHPPARTLMGPGPSDVNPRILEAMSRPTIGHLDPVFVGMMDGIKERGLTNVAIMTHFAGGLTAGVIGHGLFLLFG